MSFFNGRTYNLQTQQFDVSMASLVGRVVNFDTDGILDSFWTFSENFVEI